MKSFFNIMFQFSNIDASNIATRADDVDVNHFCKWYFHVQPSWEGMSICHRVPNEAVRYAKGRPIVVKFFLRPTKIGLISSKYKLKDAGKQVFITDTSMLLRARLAETLCQRRRSDVAAFIMMNEKQSIKKPDISKLHLRNFFKLH